MEREGERVTYDKRNNCFLKKKHNSFVSTELNMHNTHVDFQ